MKVSHIKIAEEIIDAERLKGARLSVYFRWALILLLTVLLMAQYSIGFRGESVQALTVIAFYLLSNFGFWVAAERGYNPKYIGYLGAATDIGIICYHIFNMTANFDQLAVTSAASTFLIPVVILLYTFRLDRALLYFTIIFAISCFNFIYFFNYIQSPEVYSVSLSLSPVSQMFKTAYIIFAGALCVYLQYSMWRFVENRVAEASAKADLDARISIEEERGNYARQLIEHERQLNKSLEEQIREKNRLAASLNERNEQIRSILSNLTGAAYRCKPDINWSMIFIGDPIKDITGYDPTEFINNNAISYKDVIHPGDREWVVDLIEEKTAGKEPFEVEYRVRNKTGGTVWVYESGQGIYGDDGDLLYLDGIITDITDRKSAEKSLKETRELINSIVSNLAGAASRCLFDDHFTVKYYSERIHEISGYPSSDFIDNRIRSFASIVHPDDKEFSRKIVAEAIDKRSEYSFEYRIIHREGHVVWVHENGQPVFDQAGNLLYLDGITTNVTERKLAEIALRESEKKLSRAKAELEKLNQSLEKEVVQRTRELTEANTKLIELQKENLQSQFEVLKQQVNPHFLFNSLNVLTSLIKIDPDLAESFTEKLSKVYRYVLENKEKDMVLLSTELDFMNAYVFLLDIRFMGKIFVSIDIDKSKNDLMILPMALQLLIENAIKHNTFSKANPLKIDLLIDQYDYLVVRNNIQIRETQIESTGVGLANIRNRYALISDKKPVFETTSKEFIAKIPLVKDE